MLYTRTRLPIRLLYFEELERVDAAYLREKQVQGWVVRSDLLSFTEGSTGYHRSPRSRNGSMFHVKRLMSLPRSSLQPAVMVMRRPD